MYGAWVAADDEQSIRCTVNLTQGDRDFGDFGPTLSSLDLNKGWWRPTKYTFKDSPVTQDGLRWCRYGTNACRGGPSSTEEVSPTASQAIGPIVRGL